MKFMNSERICSNMSLAAACLIGSDQPKKSLKTDFIRAMNMAQTTTIVSHDDDAVLEFENPELVSLLVRKGVFSEEEVKDGRHLLSAAERARIFRYVEDAKALIKQADPNLYSIFATLIGSVAAYQIPDRDGGTVSCCIGLIWLSPIQQWTTEYYAEMLVHEFVHNSVFLEDMVHGVMPNPELLGDEDAHVMSVIRKTRRAYDKSFHSACVGAGIMYLHHRLGNTAEADRYVPAMLTTLDELRASDKRMEAKAMPVLSDNGRELLADLDRFLADRDYAMISDALAKGSRELLASRMVA